jgi:hypothetical protein
MENNAELIARAEFVARSLEDGAQIYGNPREFRPEVVIRELAAALKAE